MTSRRQDGATTSHDRAEALLIASLAVFTRDGLRDGRIEDIAALAGISKGAVYLRFPSKAALFRASLQFAIAASAEQPEIKRQLVWIMIRDGIHFPDLIECCYRDLIAPQLATIRAYASTAEKGIPQADILARFPQLALPPRCFALIWNTLFGKFDPLDEDEFEASARQIYPQTLLFNTTASQGTINGA
jgi:AcrR family transcriptional regulator